MNACTSKYYEKMFDVFEVCVPNNKLLSMIATCSLLFHASLSVQHIAILIFLDKTPS